LQTFGLRHAAIAGKGFLAKLRSGTHKLERVFTRYTPSDLTNRVGNAPRLDHPWVSFVFPT